MLRLSTLLAICFLIAPAYAQGDKPTTKPSTKPTTKPTATDLDLEVTGRVKSPQQRVAELRGQLRKLENEMKQVKATNEDGGMVRKVRSTLGSRKLEMRSVKPAVPLVPKAPPGVSVMNNQDLETLPATTRFVIDNHVVTKSEYDELFNYLKSIHGDATEAHQEATVTMAIQAAARAKTGKAVITSTLHTLSNVCGGIENGKETLAQAAGRMSDCPISKAKGGDLGFLGRSDRDPLFMRAVFALEPGGRTKPFFSTQGLHVAECIAKVPGKTTESDKIHVRHVMVVYEADVAAIRERIMSGKAKIQFAFPDAARYAPRSKD